MKAWYVIAVIYTTKIKLNPENNPGSNGIQSPMLY